MDDIILLWYKDLINYKYWADVFYCLSYLSLSTPNVKLTKKLCSIILNSSTRWSRCYDIIIKIEWILLNDKREIIWINPSPSIYKLDEKVKDDDYKLKLALIVYRTFGWDYRQVLSYCWSEPLQKKLSTTAEKLGYSLEDYLSQMKKLINWDTFWSKVISWQTFVRKFDILSEKFSPAKNVKDFSEVADIF